MINVLIVCSGNKPDFNFNIHQAFIADQISSIEKINNQIKFHYFFIKGKGILGYLSNLKPLKQILKDNSIDLIHAHYSFSGLLANLQRKVPVIVTYHGSDVNLRFQSRISNMVQLFSKVNIFVSKNLFNKAIFKSSSLVIPCGVDLNIFKPQQHNLLRKKLNLDDGKYYILFSSTFNNPIKNFSLLNNAISNLKDKNIQVIELENYSREQVSELMNAVNLCVMTSFSEGSPQFIKEAMACNCPIISTDVGDVKEIIAQTNGCYICKFQSEDLEEKINNAIEFSSKFNRTNGREIIIKLGLDNKIIAERVLESYKNLLKKTKR